jgi:hypothetical protein
MAIFKFLALVHDVKKPEKSARKLKPQGVAKIFETLDTTRDPEM